ncbi:MAG: cupin domain-containing protein [Pirellulaceae bacterium]|nr:cupin domain-containing protein [Pirellulaceae bacterium]
MKVTSSHSVAQNPVDMPGSKGCHVRWLIGKPEEAPHFAMREFQVDPGGHTPRHHHPYEHEVYVLQGEGVIYEDDTPHSIQSGDVILVRADEVHQFCNVSEKPFRFLCMIPNAAYELPITMLPECGPQ